MNRWPLAAALLLTFSAVRTPAQAEPLAATDGTQEAKSFQGQVVVNVKLDYLLYLPQGYDQSTEKYPLLLFLHGAGESGNDVEKVKLHGPPKRIAAGESYPFIVVSPQSPEFGWKPEALDALLDHIMAQYRVDPDRVYVTGLSMGGAGTLALVAYNPSRFAAAAPICGFVRPGDTDRIAEKIKGVPFWFFHGARDRVVPVTASRDLTAKLKSLGADVKYTEYPDADHDSWTETYNNPELTAWLLSHTRKPAGGQ